MSNLSGAGLPQLVQEIKLASENIRKADEANREELEGIKASVNELFKRTGRPGAEISNDGSERKSAIEMCKSHHALTVNKIEEVEYSPSSTEVDQAINAQRGLKAYLRHGDMNRLAPEYRKGLSAFSFGPPGNFLLPPTQADRVLSCLTNPTDLSGLVDKVSISGPSLVFLIDNSRIAMGGWSCESNCFFNQPQPDLNEGLGQLTLKPETVRYVICSTRDLLEDASIDLETWLFRKISEGMNAIINSALVLGDGIGKPQGLLSPLSGIPICETSPATNPGTFSWQDLVQLAMEIPVQWQANASFLMNQRTAGLLLTMSDALNQPLLQSVQGLHDGPRWSLLGFPIYIASQMPDVIPGSTPILFGDLRRTYTIVTRKNPTISVDPYSAGFCVLYKAEARVGGGVTCPNSARLLRIR